MGKKSKIRRQFNHKTNERHRYTKRQVAVWKMSKVEINTQPINNWAWKKTHEDDDACKQHG